MSDADSLLGDLDVTNATVPSEVIREPEPSVLSGLHQGNAANMAQLGWQQPHLDAIRNFSKL